MDINQNAQEVLSFWFEELTPDKWWVKDNKLDQEINKRFGTLHKRACAIELSDWRATPQGRLAEIIVLDQFSRNIYRDDPRSFANDQAALVLSQEALLNQTDKNLDPAQKSFLYMPFMHSESLLMQTKSVELFSQKGLEDNYDFALAHYDIIKRFDRFPHRNKILARESSADEIEFLSGPNSSF
ncbi:MAG: DUF924 domain-containing protein [Bacteriovoracaceae bacterium]|nr:DUF924 domain-containing protein [Bacteriovoracaceae bacterium]